MTTSIRVYLGSAVLASASLLACGKSDPPAPAPEATPAAPQAAPTEPTSAQAVPPTPAPTKADEPAAEPAKEAPAADQPAEKHRAAKHTPTVEQEQDKQKHRAM